MLKFFSRWKNEGHICPNSVRIKYSPQLYPVESAKNNPLGTLGSEKFLLSLITFSKSQKEEKMKRKIMHEKCIALAWKEVADSSLMNGARVEIFNSAHLTEKRFSW